MTYTQLSNDVKFWIAGDSTKTIDFTAADIVSSINAYYNEVVSIILSSDNRWEWDDNNFTTLPVSTANLVSGQRDYGITAATFLDLIRLEMKDSSGNWIQLKPISYSDKRGTAMTEWAKTDGTPHSYDKVGNSFILYPTPNYSSTAGLKVYFQRPPSYFANDDTTKVPGFNPLYHRYLSMGAATDYCVVNDMTNRLKILLPKMADMRERIIDDYSRRSRDEHIKMKLRGEDYGNEHYEGERSANWK